MNVNRIENVVERGMKKYMGFAEASTLLLCGDHALERIALKLSAT